VLLTADQSQSVRQSSSFPAFSVVWLLKRNNKLVVKAVLL